jgi:hypothetical protein
MLDLEIGAAVIDNEDGPELVGEEKWEGWAT